MTLTSAPQRRIGLAERHLERREVDHVGDVPRLQRRGEGVEVGDVAAHDLDRRHLVRGHDLLEPACARAEVERRHGGALADQRPHGPGPDAAHRPGDEEPLAAHEAAPAVEPTATRSNRQVFRSRPMPSISMPTMSPSPSSTFGSRYQPTPAGVPVAMTSPGSSVKARSRTR